VYKWKYSIETQRVDGTWSRGTVWACCPGDFRKLLRYLNGDDNPSNGAIVVVTSGPPIRIKRLADEAEMEFQWPEDKVT
jgi:hypothetical protein